ncbi:hypothetical protein ACLQ2N_32425 [Streptomyces sp. DT224]|uniref:hypothetical protein n=1 Tax=Streptomyces sp. DT224 TaxID=3393426 RepID=UPI003CF0A694
MPLPKPVPSSITAAMRRVGPKPLKAVFDLVKGPAVVTATQAPRFAGRLVVAIDGTQIALADTPANLSVFPKAKAGQNGPAGYPMLLLGDRNFSATKFVDTVASTGAAAPHSNCRSCVVCPTARPCPA